MWREVFLRSSGDCRCTSDCPTARLLIVATPLPLVILESPCSLLVVTRYYSSGLLNFAAHSPEDSQGYRKSHSARLQQTGSKGPVHYRTAARRALARPRCSHRVRFAWPWVRWVDPGLTACLASGSTLGRCSRLKARLCVNWRCRCCRRSRAATTCLPRSSTTRLSALPMACLTLPPARCARSARSA